MITFEVDETRMRMPLCILASPDDPICRRGKSFAFVAEKGIYKGIPLVLVDNVMSPMVVWQDGRTEDYK